VERINTTNNAPLARYIVNTNSGRTNNIVNDISDVSARRLVRLDSRLASHTPNTTKITAKYDTRGSASKNGEHSIKPNTTTPIAKERDNIHATKPILYNVIS